MRRLNLLLCFVIVISLLYIGCQSKSPDEKFAQFNQEFFAKYVPEFPGARLLKKEDIPVKQQQFFDEENAKLQILLDMNGNNIPEYIVCGVSDSMLLKNERSAYFIAIFEQTEDGIKRLHLQRLRIPPVNLKPSDNRPGVVISFAFFSDYAAEIYFEDNAYRLERWY